MVAGSHPHQQNEAMCRRSTACVLTLSACIVAATAGAGQPLPQALQACTRLTQDSDRLACFDREVGALSGAAATEPAKPAEELTAHLRTVTRNAAGREVFTLDNGQVWQQAETRARFEAHAGEAVKITRGALGSFWLSVDAHNQTRVERISTP